MIITDPNAPIEVKNMVKITPVQMGAEDLDYKFVIFSSKDKLGKGYGYDTKSEATRARAKAVKLFKANDYIIIQ